MEKKSLTITVSGTTNTGKSTITYILSELLKNAGFEVDMDTDPDFYNEELLDAHMKERLETFNPAEHIKLKLIQSQTKRTPV